MKLVFTILSFFLFIGLVSSQKEIDVYEKKDGNKTILVARNTGKTDYTVKITITSEGMDVKPSSTVEATIPAGMMKDLATITPIPGQSWTYGYDVVFSQTLKKTTVTPLSNTAPAPSMPAATKESVQSISTTPAVDPNLSTANIILYSKPGCGRCSFAKKQLTDLGIDFEEVNTQGTSPEVNNMWTQLRNSGFKGGSVTMPVIRANGKYHYDIQDLNSFISKLKS
ncbi:MAG: glutaredoxin [Saprospiraceae bacterium]